MQLETNYYRLHGHDLPSIYEALQRNSLAREAGRSFHASTQWKIEWGYQWIASRGGCRLTQVDVSIRIDYLLPQLMGEDQLEEGVRRSWARFYAALVKHEAHHKDYGIKAATELEQVLLAVAPGPCNGLEQRLQVLANEVINRYDAMEKEYDRVTDHGVNEGVVLR